ncbi:MAG: hypothetical protein NTV94_18070 [Planctomycetota bacterium]|nr:hypothetical protein [Planctomycetota bacterium]
MREIEAIHGEGLFTRYAQCSDVSQACELLHSEYFDHALLEASNDLRHWRLGHDHRRAAEEESQLRKDGDELRARVAEWAGRLEEAGCRKREQERIVRETTSIMILAMIERRWNMPIDDRIFSPLDAVIADGHIVCGWAGGLYPEGEWVVW